MSKALRGKCCGAVLLALVPAFAEAAPGSASFMNGYMWGATTGVCNPASLGCEVGKMQYEQEQKREQPRPPEPKDGGQKQENRK